MPYQFLHRNREVAKQINADTGVGTVLQGLALKRLSQPRSYFVINGLGIGRRFRGIKTQGLQQDHEFIAAKARNGVRFAHTGLQPGGHFQQQLIALRMAAGVIDVLEVVKINEHQTTENWIPGTASQGLLKSVQEQGAISQPGERVMVCQMLNLSAAARSMRQVTLDEHPMRACVCDASDRRQIYARPEWSTALCIIQLLRAHRFPSRHRLLQAIEFNAVGFFTV